MLNIAYSSSGNRPKYFVLTDNNKRSQQLLPILSQFFFGSVDLRLNLVELVEFGCWLLLDKYAYI